jgi:hypothetical protein
VGMKLLLVGFALRQSLRPYSYALSGLNEESTTSYLASPRMHSPVGQLVFLDIHGVAHLCTITD